MQKQRDRVQANEEMLEIVGEVTKKIMKSAALDIVDAPWSGNIEECLAKLHDTVNGHGQISLMKNDKEKITAIRQYKKCIKVITKLFHPDAEPIIPWFYTCHVCADWLDDAYMQNGNDVCNLCVVQNDTIVYPNHAITKAVTYHRRHFLRFQQRNVD